jgi:hypothetical protein
MFEIKVDSVKKALIIKVGGFFQEEEAKDFINTYNRNVASIRPSEYNLVLVADELSTSKQEMLPVLEGVINMYKSTGFKNYYSTTPRSVIAKIQLNKVAVKCNMKVTFGGSLEETLNMI